MKEKEAFALDERALRHAGLSAGRTLSTSRKPIGRQNVGRPISVSD
jgi:hypothetical protein